MTKKKSVCEVFARRSTVIVVIGSLLMLGACGGNKDHYVIAATGTVIGIDVGQNPATQTPEAKIGYHRGELALVPTNRKLEGTAAEGAEESTDVLMEIYFGTSLQGSGESVIYQRLAVGRAAVGQPGAGVLFAKTPQGELDEEAAKALEAAGGVPVITGGATKARRKISKIYKACLAKDKADSTDDNTESFSAKVAAVYPSGYKKFHASETSADQIDKVWKAVKDIDC